MKRILSNILVISAVALGFASCEKSNLDPLEGVFQAPVDVTYTSAVVNGIEKSSASRTFDVTLKGGTGADLELFIVGNKFYINPSTYSANSAYEAGVGNYISGNSKYGSTPIETGGLTLKADSDTWTEGVNYTISGTIWLTDGQIYRVSGTFPLTFEEDIDPDVMSDVKSVAAEGVTCHTITLYNANGAVTANFQLNRADGADIEGTYAVASYATADLTAGNGWDFSAYVPGLFGGSYYYDDNNKMVLINEGESIVVTKNADLSYTFNVGGVKFYGKSADGAVCIDTVAAEGVTCHTITVTSSATGKVLANIVLNRADGQSLAGTYDVKSYATADMTAGNGYDLRPYGMAFYGGTYFLVDDELVFIEEGNTVKVEALGSVYKATVGEYSVTFEISSHTTAAY